MRAETNSEKGKSDRTMTREEAIFYIKELQKTYASMDKKVFEAVSMAIEALLVDIVKCKDCYHCTEYYDKDGYPYWICDEWDSGTDADGFCHYGEK